jgi:hypothetical protein
VETGGNHNDIALVGTGYSSISVLLRRHSPPDFRQH